MRAFDASDVLYKARVISRSCKAALQDAERRRRKIPPSQFLREISWVVAGVRRLRSSASSSPRGTDDGDGGSTDSNQPTGPGLHGTGLNAHRPTATSTLAAGRLEPARPTSRARRSRSSFTNQGDNDEFNIKVTLKIARASGGSPITLNKTVPQIAKGEKATVELPLNREPPLGTVAQRSA